jgi:hypothetical protein
MIGPSYVPYRVRVSGGNILRGGVEKKNEPAIHIADSNRHVDEGMSDGTRNALRFAPYEVCRFIPYVSIRCPDI